MLGTFIIAALVGVGIGVLSGMLGVGGGVVMVPIFRLAFGLSPIGATATSLFTIIPTSISGAVAHLRGKTCIPWLGIALGVGGACLSPLGVWLTQISPGWLVMVVAAIAIGYSAYNMVRKALKVKPQQEMIRKNRAPESFALDRDTQTIVRALLIGACAGVISGYIGLGGGFIMVPMMIALLNMPMRQASGTSLIAVMILATPATIMQCYLGNVDYLVGIAVACGSIPGALFGARLASRVPERTLRLIFAAFLGIAAILLVVKELGLLG